MFQDEVGQLLVWAMWFEEAVVQPDDGTKTDRVAKISGYHHEEGWYEHDVARLERSERSVDQPATPSSVISLRSSEFDTRQAAVVEEGSALENREPDTERQRTSWPSTSIHSYHVLLVALLSLKDEANLPDEKYGAHMMTARSWIPSQYSKIV